MLPTLRSRLNLGPELVKLVDDAAGITAFDAELEADVPTELVAVTEKVYETPLVNPRTDTEPTWEVDATKPPGVDVIVYSVIAEPPSFVGAVKETVAEEREGTANPTNGASGTTALAV